MLAIAEKLLCYMQGKGFGAKSIGSEVSAVSRFIKGGVVFDVGSNKGDYTRAILSKLGGEITRLYCFEPSPKLVSRYLQFDDPRITVVQCALGKTPGSTTLWVSDTDSGLSSMTKRRLNHFNIEMKDGGVINVDTVDSFAKANEVNVIDLLKLDVEGHELDVLEGAHNMLSQNKIGCIQFEFGGCNIDTRTFFQDFWYLLAVKHTFSLFRISPFGPIRVKKYREIDETFLTTNYIAVR